MHGEGTCVANGDVHGDWGMYGKGGMHGEGKHA